MLILSPIQFRKQEPEIKVGGKYAIEFGWSVHEAEVTKLVAGRQTTIVQYRISFYGNYSIGWFAKLLGHYYSRSESIEMFKQRMV